MYIKRIILVIALIGLVVMGFVSYKIYDLVFAPNTDFEEEKVAVYIASDAEYADVRKQLDTLLKNIEEFDMVAQRKGYASNIRAGKYLLRKGMNNNEIVNALRSGNVPVSVTYNNQERLEDLAGRIAGQIEADSLSLLKAMKDTAFLKAQGLDLKNALGMYIPNKYEFFWNTSAEGFRERMLKEYKRFWNEERLAKAEAIGLTPQEVTVIASIVQKETAKVSERPKVAGVYMNRINNGWKLDADPTVIYAIKNKSQNFDTIIKRVLYKDLTLDSSYNPSIHKG